MAIPVLNFLNAPVQGDPIAAAIMPAITRGIQMYYMPKQEKEQLQKAKLANALSQVQLNYAPQMSQAALDEKQAMGPYYQALTQAANARTQNALNPSYHPSSNLAKLQADLDYATKMYGPESDRVKELKQQIQMTLQGKPGVTVYDPKTGNPLVNFGGTQGNKSGGGTYVDPKTSNVVVTNTTTQTSNDLKALAANKNVEQYLNKVIETLPQFQTAGKQFQLIKDSFSNKFLGGTSEIPSQYAAGKAALNTVVEGLIKELGLNPTTANVNRIAKIVEPEFGESTEGYKNRVRSQLSDYAASAQNIKNRLAQGTIVGKSNAFGSNPGDIITPQQQQKIAQFAQYTHAPGFTVPQGSSESSVINDENLQYTAKKYGMTVEQLKQKLGI